MARARGAPGRGQAQPRRIGDFLRHESPRLDIFPHQVGGYVTDAQPVANRVHLRIVVVDSHEVFARVLRARTERPRGLSYDGVV